MKLYQTNNFAITSNTSMAHLFLNPLIGSLNKFYLLSGVSVTPSVSDLPGSNVLQQLANGIAGWALVLSLVSMVIGAAAWALGAHSQNVHQTLIGRRTVLISIGASLIIGAAPALINFFYNAGSNIH